MVVVENFWNWVTGRKRKREGRSLRGEKEKRHWDGGERTWILSALVEFSAYCIDYSKNMSPLWWVGIAVGCRWTRARERERAVTRWQRENFDATRNVFRFWQRNYTPNSHLSSIKSRHALMHSLHLSSLQNGKVVFIGRTKERKKRNGSRPLSSSLSLSHTHTFRDR